MKPLIAALLAIALMAEPQSLHARGTHTIASASISLPADYAAWRHVKTQIIQEGPGFERFGGMHHIYANEAAVRGLQSRRFENGAMLVAEFRELARKGNVIDGASIRIVDVMLFDARRFPDTNGWGYAEFVGPELAPRTFDNRSECHGCHQTRAAQGYVFSELPK